MTKLWERAKRIEGVFWAAFFITLGVLNLTAGDHWVWSAGEFAIALFALAWFQHPRSPGYRGRKVEVGVALYMRKKPELMPSRSATPPPPPPPSAYPLTPGHRWTRWGEYEEPVPVPGENVGDPHLLGAQPKTCDLCKSWEGRP